MISAPSLGNLRTAVSFAAEEFAQSRARQEKRLDEGMAWRELVACLVGGATRYEHAAAATDTICLQLPAPWNISRRAWRDIRSGFHNGAVVVPTRFPREHARYIASAIEVLYVGGGGLGAMLDGPAHVLRADLTRNILGIGPKQASLFLLNTGVTDDVAVLDRHVLRYMVWIGAIDGARPPRSLREYEAVESTFRDHAEALGFAVADLDRAAWLASKVWGEICQ